MTPSLAFQGGGGEGGDQLLRAYCVVYVVPLLVVSEGAAFFVVYPIFVGL